MATTKSKASDAEKPAPGWEDRRADARRNHERVLAAAIEVFTEHGLEATVPEVAARAGVGKATVYRSYPTKADLIRAIAQVHVDWLGDVLRRSAASAETDAAEALGDFLREVTARLAVDRLMVEVLASIDTGQLSDAESHNDLEHILALGREQRTLRADVSLMDIRVLVSGFARALIDLGIHDAEVWSRYTTLTLAALRP